MTKRSLAWLTWLAVLPSSPAQAQRLGPEFQVNTNTAGEQWRPSVASDAAGNFVVAWERGVGLGISGQRYDTGGNPLGGEFQVNTYAADMSNPCVATDASGNFVVVWGGPGDGDSAGVFGQRYDSGGNRIGGEFRVNTETMESQGDASVALDAFSNFVVVWESWFAGDDVVGVFGQRFDKDGNPLGDEFQVNTNTAGGESYGQYPSVASDASGNFVVVWDSARGNSSHDVFGQRYDSEGNSIGSEFQVNTHTESVQKAPSVASDAGGNFVVAWESWEQDNDEQFGHGVFGQRYDSDGTRVGGEFQVNTYTTYDQEAPRVASDASGNFVVVWKGQDGPGANNREISGQRYDNAGNRVGGEFQVNTYVTGQQSEPQVASDASGNFVVIWESPNQDGDDRGIFGQRFSAACEASVEVLGDIHTPGSTIAAQVHIAHRRPKIVTVPWELRLFDANGQRIVRQTTQPHAFEPGDVVDRVVQFHLPHDLTAGTYTLELAISGMAGTKGSTTTIRAIASNRPPRDGEQRRSDESQRSLGTGLFLLPIASVFADDAVLGPTPRADWKAEGGQNEAAFGSSVARAGDVNGDGFDDVIVGARFFGFHSGKAFAYYGSASGLSITPDWTAKTQVPGDDFGESVGTAGDVNGDGYDDVIVGARSGARVFVFHGSASGLSLEPDWMAVGDGSELVNSVGTAGDVNGDGYDDVMIGFSDAGEGRAFAYYGSSSGLSHTPDWTAEDDQVNSGFGYSVGTAGDVNGDGYGDVIVGAVSYEIDQVEVGKVFLYQGSASGLSHTPDWTAEGDEERGDFGLSVATADDVNGDGYDDVIVGAPAQPVGDHGLGRAFAYLGSASGLALTPDWTAESDQAYSDFGASVATTGDVNRDGYDDVIVGAPFYDHGQLDEGRAFVYSGSASGLSPQPNWSAEGDDQAGEFGASVAGAGDVNGDGYADVIVGMPNYDNGAANEGAAFVYHGPLSCQAALQVQGDVHPPGSTLLVQVHLAHNRPETVTVPWELRLTDASGQRIARHRTEPHTFVPGDVIDRDVHFQLPNDLAPGTYTLELAISGMAGTKGATTTFRVVSPE